MRNRFLLSTCLLTAVFLATAWIHRGANGQSIHREVAITFDDLPLQERQLSIESQREITKRLLQSITSNHVPAFADVNEGKLYVGGKPEPAHVELLKMWLNAGFELGNHTFSHADFQTTLLASYEADVIRGETITKKLLHEKGLKLRYFRHPVLHTGPDPETKKAFEQFLAAHGYTVAPVTIDNQDFMFAEVYARARKRGDQATMKRVADAYVPYMEKMFDFFEKLSVDSLGYEVKQVLLLHANELNADHFNDLVRMMKIRGYSFITLEEALKDKAYALPDDPTPKGLSWLHRWMLAKGQEMKPEPREPEFINQLFNAYH
jgi:peptidoglycan/xylan/chitin deacetylase (PgdA/CDA1 family)